MSQRCPFANILGEPGKGVHSWRIGPFAGADIIATIVAAIITAYIYKINLVYSLIGWFVVGELAHWVFGTQTAALKILGIAPQC